MLLFDLCRLGDEEIEELFEVEAGLIERESALEEALGLEREKVKVKEKVEEEKNTGEGKRERERGLPSAGIRIAAKLPRPRDSSMQLVRRFSDRQARTLPAARSGVEDLQELPKCGRG